MAAVAELPKLLTISQAAERLGISAATLRVWADKGYIDVVKLPSGYRRFSEQEVERRRQSMGIKD